MSSPILTPILSYNLFAPILYTPNILFHITRCEMILSKISGKNIVKQYLINELNKQIIVCAIESSHTENMLKHISQIENYDIERGIQHFRDSKGESHTIEYIKSSTINDITRNDYSYNCPFLSFHHVFLSKIFITYLKSYI